MVCGYAMPDSYADVRFGYPGDWRTCEGCYWVRPLGMGGHAFDAWLAELPEGSMRAVRAARAMGATEYRIAVSALMCDLVVDGAYLPQNGNGGRP
jgi:hypothetical protein